MKTPTGVLFLRAGIVALILSAVVARAQEVIPALLPVPSTWPRDARQNLTATREALEKRLSDFQTEAGGFNAKPAESQTAEEYAALMKKRGDYIADAKAFNKEMVTTRRALLAWGVQRVAVPMDAYVRRLGWSQDKRDWLRDALYKLDLDWDPENPDAVRQAWQDIRARGQDPAIMRNAALVHGVEFPNAGRQSFQDCAVFALANATERPYSLVAALANELIRDGEWREARERADPPKTIEDGGLTGGEVILISGIYGEAEVIPSAKFAQALSDGRPVMVGLKVPGGGGHEAVLTKAFPHNGETWFEMMDSSQGPLERRYLSRQELDTLLRENGVVYHPAAGTVAPLLRDAGGP